jgi:hypothetical protein
LILHWRRNVTTPTTTLQRFIDHVQAAIGHGILTDATGAPSHVERFQKVIPFAREIVLFGDPLDATSEALGDYIKAEQAALDAGPDEPTDPDHACEKAAINDDVIYFTALAVGLLLADQVKA